MLRKRTRTEHSILVTHTDVPENDFTALFRTLSDDPDTYLEKDQKAFASAVGRSFYSQILPSDSVNLGWSSWAIQWLSGVPGPVPDHVQVAYSRDDAIRTAYARQAARDWHEFVAFRGRELSPGGRLVVMTMAIGEDGEFGYEQLLDAMMATLAELVGTGLVTADERSDMSIPTVGRRARDFLAPFAPSGTFEKSSIAHLEVFDAEDRFYDQYRVDKDAKAFGARWAAFARASVFPTLAAAMYDSGKPDRRGRRGRFLDALEAGIATRLAADPQRMQIPLAQLVIEKKPRPS